MVYQAHFVDYDTVDGRSLALTCVSLNITPTSRLCASHSMSEVEKTARSSETPEAAVPSAPEPHPASGNSLAAVGNVRTLQDVQRDIQDENVTLLRFRGKYDNALSACDDARTASRREPTNTSLSEDLADARESRDGYKRLMDNSEKRLEKLGAELARLQAAANASSGQKSKYLFRVYSVLSRRLCCSS